MGINYLSKWIEVQSLAILMDQLVQWL